VAQPELALVAAYFGLTAALVVMLMLVVRHYSSVVAADLVAVGH